MIFHCGKERFFNPVNITTFHSRQGKKSEPTRAMKGDDRNLSFWLVTAPALFLVAAIVPSWAILLAWACVGELTAAMLDVWGWRKRKSRTSGAHSSLNNKDRKFTWQEVRRHNTAESLWVAVDGKVYDVTNFLESHPGGKEFLLLGAGRDVTDLLQCYHPFTDKPNEILQKYLIGELTSFEHPRFRPDSGFYRECRERVKEYFDRMGLDSKYPGTGLLRMVPVYVTFFATFFFTHFYTSPEFLALRVVSAVVFGISQAIPLTHWMHDASHAAIGHTERWWWYCGRLSLDWLSGSSMVAWHNQHIIGHHVYTNVLGSDPDLPVDLRNDVRRLIPQQVWKKLYSYQHIYLPPLYGILAIRSRIVDIVDVFIGKRNGPIHVNPISPQDILRQIATKSFFAFARFVVPYHFLGLGIMQFAPLFIVSELSTGFWLAYNFQVSHISLDADYYVNKIGESGEDMINEEWAKLQVKTSVDYAHGSVFDTFFSGALNYQTTHHLFPCVSQYHYPKIAPIIMDVCKKHGITYNVLPSYASAIGSHFLHLKNMGIQGKCVPLKLD